MSRAIDARGSESQPSLLNRRHLLALPPLAFLLRPHQATAETPRSGEIVRRFLEALDRADLETALALLAPDITLTLPDGVVLAGRGNVAPYLEASPRPVIVQDRHFIGRGTYQASVTAGGTPLNLHFLGVSGQIFSITLTESLG